MTKPKTVTAILEYKRVSRMDIKRGAFYYINHELFICLGQSMVSVKRGTTFIPIAQHIYEPVAKPIMAKADYIAIHPDSIFSDSFKKGKQVNITITTKQEALIIQ